PDASGVGYAAFTFQVKDNGGTTAGGVDLDPNAKTITFNVTSVNDPPMGTDARFLVVPGTVHTFSASDFGFSDPTDVPPNVLASVIIVSLPLKGALTLNGVAVTAGQEIAGPD